MLAFDIETTGLDGHKHDVTVVCTEDFHTGERIAYEFDRIKKQDPAHLQQLKRDLVTAFNNATSLCAFNGIRFDIPFLRNSLKLDNNTVNAWLLKTTDILEACRLGKFGPRHTFGLNLLCEFNGIKMKTSSGKEAINMAHANRWDELKNYCVEDVRILCDLYRKRHLRNPRGYAMLDLSKIAHADVYAPRLQASNDTIMTEAGSKDTTSKETTKKPQTDEDDIDSLIQESIELTNEQRIAQLEAENKQLKEKLQVYLDFCTCL